VQGRAPVSPPVRRASAQAGYGNRIGPPGSAQARSHVLAALRCSQFAPISSTLDNEVDNESRSYWLIDGGSAVRNATRIRQCHSRSTRAGSPAFRVLQGRQGRTRDARAGSSAGVAATITACRGEARPAPGTPPLCACEPILGLPGVLWVGVGGPEKLRDVVRIEVRPRLDGAGDRDGRGVDAVLPYAGGDQRLR
jgi:hypothetical protein